MREHARGALRAVLSRACRRATGKAKGSTSATWSRRAPRAPRPRYSTAAVDVSWGGPMRVMMHHDADPRCPLVCFGQVVARDPFLLVGRTRKPGVPLARSRRPARRAGRRRADAVDDLPGRPAARRPRPGGDRRAPRAADGAQPRGLSPRHGGRGSGLRAVCRSPGERRPRPRLASLQRARRHRLHDFLSPRGASPARGAKPAGGWCAAWRARRPRSSPRRPARSPTRSRASCRSFRARRSRASSALIARAACGRRRRTCRPRRSCG